MRQISGDCSLFSSRSSIKRTKYFFSSGLLLPCFRIRYSIKRAFVRAATIRVRAKEPEQTEQKFTNVAFFCETFKLRNYRWLLVRLLNRGPTTVWWTKAGSFFHRKRGKIFLCEPDNLLGQQLVITSFNDSVYKVHCRAEIFNYLGRSVPLDRKRWADWSSTGKGKGVKRFPRHNPFQMFFSGERTYALRNYGP